MELDAVLLVHAPHPLPHVRAEHLFEWDLVGGDHRHGEAPGPERRRDFQPDEAGTNHHHLLRRGCGCDDRLAVGERPEQMHMRQLRTGNGQTHRLGAGGQQQPVIRHAAIVVQLHFMPGGIDGHRRGVENYIDGLLGVELARPERDPFFLGIAGQVVLGKVGPVVRQVRFHSDHGDPALEAGPTQHLRRGVAGSTRTHDDDALGGGDIGRLGGRNYQPVAHRNPSILPSDDETRHRLEGWCMDCLAGGEIEAGVVPGTAHLAIHQQPFRQRTAPVGAGGADGVDRVAHSGDQHRLAMRVSQQHRAVRQLRFPDPDLEIRATQFRVLAHELELTGAWPEAPWRLPCAPRTPAPPTRPAPSLPHYRAPAAGWCSPHQ